MIMKYDLTEPPGKPSESPRVAGASNAQLKFLRTLATDREIPEASRSALLARISAQAANNAERGDRAYCDAGVSLRRASEFIERLKEKPYRQRSSNGTSGDDLPGPDVLPAGHYALDNQDGELRFYHLKRGTKNPNRIWLHVEHGPDSTELPWAVTRSIVKQIAEAGPRECALRYGREIKACSVCARRLTNRLSRLLDIGPVCGGRFYTEEEWDDRRERGRDALRAAGLDPSADAEASEDIDLIREQAGL